MSLQDDLHDTATQVVTRVARARGLDAADVLNSASRVPEVLAARHAVFLELHTKLSWSGNRIGSVLGFDASGVNRALAKVRP